MTDTVHNLPAMVPVKSSHIESIGHDADGQTLYVRFKDAGTYAYSGVDGTKFHQLRQAESVGSHFHRHVKSVHHGRKV